MAQVNVRMCVNEMAPEDKHTDKSFLKTLILGKKIMLLFNLF